MAECELCDEPGEPVVAFGCPMFLCGDCAEEAEERYRETSEFQWGELERAVARTVRASWAEIERGIMRWLP